MIDIRTKKDLKDFPVLENEELYIYVMEDAENKVKIGKTKNINQRYNSLCGSNSRGVPIVRVFVSDKTYLYTIERIMHEYFKKYRIPNTEWFSGVTFKEVVTKLLLIFSSSDYGRANEVRKEFNKLNIIKKEKKDESNK